VPDALDILVVEDNEVNQLMTRAALEHLDHQVTIAPDGASAIDLADERRFDLILMDLMMPGLDGYQASRSILQRARERGDSLPKIWALSAELSEEDKARCSEAGLQRWLTKPINPDEFTALVSQGPIRQAELLSRVKSKTALGKIVDLYTQSYPQRLQELQSAIIEREDEAARRVAHTLKGNLLNFSAPRGARLAHELEMFIGAESWERAAVALPEFEAACHEVAEALRELVGHSLDTPRETRRISSSGTGFSVIVADADDANRAICSEALHSEGYEVVEASDGREVLDILKERSVDVILMGVLMSRLGGFEACRKLKTNPQTQMIPVLLVTALEEPSARIEGMDAGADDFISKPIDPREVSLRVRNAARGKSLYDQLQSSFDDLQRLEQLRDGLTHMLVHDLRTPLTAIKGYASLLTSGFSQGMNEQQLKFATKIVSQSNRLVDMVSDILAVSKLESDEMPLELGDVDLTALLRRHQEEWNGIPDKQLDIVAEQDVSVQADGELLTRVLSNLLSNAFKYSPPGQPVTLKLKGNGEMAELLIIDRGPGIPDEYKSRVFEKFTQVAGADHKRAKSTGLGLAFCQLVVEKHGGTIGVRDADGGGSEFWLTLPVCRFASAPER
jgi:two-component system sensor histidine kinase/response regulator